MAKVILKFKGAVIREYPVTGATLSIGRGAGNDIVIDHPAVSSAHARLVAEAGRYAIEDLNSTNGTFVNGQRIARLLLRHNAVLSVGQHTLHYLDPAAAESDADATTMVRRPLPDADATQRLDARAPAPAEDPDATTVRGALPKSSTPDPDATMVRAAVPPGIDADATMMRPARRNSPESDPDATIVRTAAPRKAPPGEDADATILRPAGGSSLRPPSPIPAAAAPGSSDISTGIGLLTVLAGAAEHPHFELKKRLTTFGKGEGAEIRIKGFFAPKVAALINRTAAGYVLNPVQGEKPPLLNGKAIESGVLLKNLDILKVANLQLRFSLQEEQPAASADGKLSAADRSKGSVPR